MSLSTTVGEARTNSRSLRVTIPTGIVAYLNLRAGDEVEWRMENGPDGRRIATMRRMEPDE